MASLPTLSVNVATLQNVTIIRYKNYVVCCISVFILQLKCELSAKNIQANKIIDLHSTEQTNFPDYESPCHKIQRKGAETQRAQRMRGQWEKHGFAFFAPLRWIFITQALLHMLKTGQFSP